MCKISVIIPIYNAEKYLNNTLTSIQEQSLEDIEIICIDDGSTDDSKLIVKGKQKQDSRIKYLYQKNQGAATARNYGISISKGEYIAFMDADDSYPNKFVLEKLYNSAIMHNAIVCGGSIEKNKIEKKMEDKRVFCSEGYIKFSEYQFDLLYVRFVFKREFIFNNRILFPKLRVYEDPLFLMYVLYEAKKFYAITDEVYSYSGSHQCNDMSLKKVEDYLKGIIEELQFTSKNELIDLHRLVWKRLEKEASYYAEKYVYQGNKTIYCLLLQANEAIDKKALQLNEDYILPVLISIFNAGNKYMRIRNVKSIKYLLNLLRR